MGKHFQELRHKSIEKSESPASLKQEKHHLPFAENLAVWTTGS